jgi:transposase
VARRNGLAPSQVYAWRRDLRNRLEAEGVILPSAEPEAREFVPAVIAPSTMPDPALIRRARRRRRAKGAAVEL